jgi:hypothetical protein
MIVGLSLRQSKEFLNRAPLTRQNPALVITEAESCERTHRHRQTLEAGQLVLANLQAIGARFVLTDFVLAHGAQRSRKNPLLVFTDADCNEGAVVKRLESLQLVFPSRQAVSARFVLATFVLVQIRFQIGDLVGLARQSRDGRKRRKFADARLADTEFANGSHCCFVKYTILIGPKIVQFYKRSDKESTTSYDKRSDINKYFNFLTF